MARTEPRPDGDAERPRLGTVFNRLDEILRELDRDDADLEEQLALYREACQHLGSARKILDESQAEIEILMSEADNDPAARQ
ncbi:MAG: exodeoxyribonuclease VII small subunit [Gemmatimonadetes bacterium]|nr:exodeoxyribonuclease VII small subunit [Gemmatimonadota bacterium]